MDDLTDLDYARALGTARRFLRRWEDSFTASVREDLAQEAVVAVWRGRDTIRDRRRLDAYVRTLVRRMRCRALRERRGRVHRQLGDDLRADEPCGGRDATVLVGQQPVDRAWLLAGLGSALDELGADNAALVREFYGGASCRELAERYGLSARAVTARLHRGRQRLRAAFEARLRRAKRSPVHRRAGGEPIAETSAPRSQST